MPSKFDTLHSNFVNPQEILIFQNQIIFSKVDEWLPQRGVFVMNLILKSSFMTYFGVIWPKELENTNLNKKISYVWV